MKRKQNKFRRPVSILCLVFLVTIKGYAQEKHAQYYNQVWMAYFNQTRFSDKWGLWADLHLRTKEDFFTNFSQSILRFGVTYYLNDVTKLTAGYAYVSNYPGDNHKEVTQPEHRAWQQVQWHNKYAKIRTMQWFRLEEKFKRKILDDAELASGYTFNYKMRYNFSLQAPLSKKGLQPNTLSFVVSDELHINFGKQIVYNYFDQNRFFLGFAFQTNKTDNLQFGYMNLFQQLASGNQYKMINAARIYYYHNIDLRKK
jgi:hypothetical protein